MTVPKITLVTPVYNEQESLPHYLKAVEETLFSRKEYDFHVVFVDDGSSDRSWEVIRGMCDRNPRFTGIRLSRNYGAHVAVTAGLSVAEGAAVAVLPCDLQDPVAVIPQFLEKWKTGARIVWGKRRTRQDALWRRLTSFLFFLIVRRIAMPKGSRFTTGGFFLIDRKVADSYLQFQERNPITFAIVAWTGFEQATVEYDRDARVAGKSGWRLSAMIKSMYDVIIGYSPVPVRLITVIGVVASLFSVALALSLLYTKLTGSPRPGWTASMLTVSVFFGIQFLMTGLMGEYLYRIYAEVVRRPLYLVADRIGSDSAGRVPSPR